MELPLGAVRTADGRVEIPESTRADGSKRRAIRVREGYVPPDEVRAYRTPAQRRREEEKKRRGEHGERPASSSSSGGAAEIRKSVRPGRSEDASELSLASLSLRDSASSPRRQPPPARGAREDKAPAREERAREPLRGHAAPASGRLEADRSAFLKKEVTRINRLLKDIAALEKAAPDALTPAQHKKVARKEKLQREKSAVVAELNGATVERSASAAAAGTTRAVISL